MTQIDAFFKVGNDTGVSDCVIEAYGDMGGDDSQRLRDILAAGLGETPTRLIVDLAGVTSIGRPALSALAAARRQGRSLGTDLVLRSPSEATVHEIDRAGLAGLLPVVCWHDDRAPRPSPTSWPAASSDGNGVTGRPGEIDLR